MNNNTGTVYLSGSNVKDDEYLRPISIHGSQLAVYTRVNSASAAKNTTSRLIVSNTKYELGNDNTLLQLNNNNNIELKTTNSKLVDIHNGTGNLQIGSGIVFKTTGSKTETITGNSTDTSANKTITGKSTTIINGNNSSISLKNNYIDLASNSNNARLLLHSSNASYLNVGSSLNINSNSSLSIAATSTLSLKTTRNG